MATAIRPDEVTDVLRQELGNFSSETDTYEVGTVLQVGDGIAKLVKWYNESRPSVELPEDGAQQVAVVTPEA